jgi:cation diffusion facilitator family transporter
LPVAVLGLVVNLISVRLLHHDHDHEEHDHEEHDHAEGEHHHEEHDHAEGEHHHDHNLRAAYFHVLADALTSVLAILALLGGRYFGWQFLDAAMGIVGGVVIARWSYALCRQAARQLLDVVPSAGLARRIRAGIEQQFAGAQVVDLHLWEIGPHARACIVSVAAPTPEAPSVYRAALASIARLEHVTIEVQGLPPALGTSSGE